MIRISLAAARVNARMSQRDAAEALGVSTKTIVNWEKGRTFPSVAQADKICTLYHVSMDDIIFFIW